MNHARYMRVALQLARRQLGATWPNPSVGAVVVKDGQIMGAAATARGGRPHAEPQALAEAAGNTKGATLYVTLEPCCHHGQTPPCTDAIIAAGITHVLVACKDPNPLMSGRGIALLRQAGIEVSEGVLEREAEETHRGFFSVVTRNRPYVALKIATSLDGHIATRTGQSQWITSKKAREYGHLLRSRYDAIATGSGTVLADDPLLTCRLPGLEDRSPVRVVFDRRGRVGRGTKLMQSTDISPVWPMTLPLEQALSDLSTRGITRLLVEAGAELSTAFLQSGLVDRIYWLRAPLIIGSDGLAGVGGGFATELSALRRWTTAGYASLDTDNVEILECSPASSAA